MRFLLIFITALSLAASGHVLAQTKNNGKGPRASINVETHCYTEGTLFKVETVITEDEDSEVSPILSTTIQPLQRIAGSSNGNKKIWQYLDGPATSTGYKAYKTVDLCTSDLDYETATALNAEVKVSFTYGVNGSDERTVIGMCDDILAADDPYNLIDESDVPVPDLSSCWPLAPVEDTSVSEVTVTEDPAPIVAETPPS